MEWIPVQSRLISAIAYQAQDEILHVRLRTRHIRTYKNIAPGMFELLRTAESPGFYYSYYIAGQGQHREAGRYLRALTFRPMRIATVLTLTCVFFVSNI